MPKKGRKYRTDEAVNNIREHAEHHARATLAEELLSIFPAYREEGLQRLMAFCEGYTAGRLAGDGTRPALGLYAGDLADALRIIRRLRSIADDAELPF